MKKRVTLILLFLFVIGVLVSLNALTYVQSQQEPDSELNPNRSTYNPGATGTEAFYTLLFETGRRPVRWTESPEALAVSRNKPDVFVLVGQLRREVSDQDAANLMKWVEDGGRLVIIDRDPPQNLLPPKASWKIVVSSKPAVELMSADPSDQKQMTVDTLAAKPIQPTLFTHFVNAVQPSRFAGQIEFERNAAQTDSENDPRLSKSELTSTDEMLADQPPGEDIPISLAPVVHLTNDQKNLLVDVPYGSGKIVYLSDPYIVSNAGLRIVDNAQLSINLVSTGEGTVAFDEYHQGYGTNANRLFQYFEGTPVIAIFLQCALLLGVLFLSQSRRFSRPLPAKESDRLSRLEYVAAMAELQQRAHAYDLAIENIYSDFRRRVTRVLGLDNAIATRRDISLGVSERTGSDASFIDELMAKCEDVIYGESTNKAEAVELIARLRQIEDKLGIRRKPKGATPR